ncbi:PAS-domain containing protein [Bradyrhizobium sp. ISRA435]|nr:PAS-domain containing protein [Bradyrhizobium sp. ISRA435]
MAAVVILTVIVVLMLKRHQISDQRLAAERRNLSTAVNNIPQGLILYDASARIIICNRPYLEMFGLSPDIAKPGLHDAAADRAPPGRPDRSMATSTNSAMPSFVAWRSAQHAPHPRLYRNAGLSVQPPGAGGRHPQAAVVVSREDRFGRLTEFRPHPPAPVVMSRG